MGCLPRSDSHRFVTVDKRDRNTGLLPASKSTVVLTGRQLRLAAPGRETLQVTAQRY